MQSIWCRNSDSRYCEGFSLIEVMIALSLLAIGVVGTMSVQEYRGRTDRLSQNNLAADNLAATMRAVLGRTELCETNFKNKTVAPSADPKAIYDISFPAAYDVVHSADIPNTAAIYPPLYADGDPVACKPGNSTTGIVGSLKCAPYINTTPAYKTDMLTGLQVLDPTLMRLVGSGKTVIDRIRIVLDRRLSTGSAGVPSAFLGNVVIRVFNVDAPPPGEVSRVPASVGQPWIDRSIPISVAVDESLATPTVSTCIATGGSGGTGTGTGTGIGLLPYNVDTFFDFSKWMVYSGANPVVNFGDGVSRTVAREGYGVNHIEFNWSGAEGFVQGISYDMGPLDHPEIYYSGNKAYWTDEYRIQADLRNSGFRGGGGCSGCGHGLVTYQIACNSPKDERIVGLHGSWDGNDMRSLGVICRKNSDPCSTATDYSVAEKGVPATAVNDRVCQPGEALVGLAIGADFGRVRNIALICKKAYDGCAPIAPFAPPPPPPPPPPDTTAPVITIDVPIDGAALPKFATNYQIQVTASDNVAVTKVECFLDNNSIPFATDPTSPFTSLYLNVRQNVTSGAHTISCSAYDAAGNIGVSADVNVTK